MMKQWLAALLSAGILTGAVCGPVLPAAAENEVNSTLPLVTRYDAPATDWESQALPIGNGFIGGMIFGGVETERVQINEHTLWSGGPGAYKNFDGGAEGKAENIHKALQEVRQALQTEVDTFRKNHAATENNGKVTAYNYTNASSIVTKLNQLKGEKNQFGSYQTLGNLNLIDPAYIKPILKSATSNAEPTNGEQVASNMFDGSVKTKWYAGNSKLGDGIKAPFIAEWEYTDVMAADSYTVSSAEDVEGRDPTDWILYGSTDGKDWKQLDSQTGVTFANRGTTKSFPLPERVEYAHYKIEITKTKENLPVQISEIDLVDSHMKSHQKYQNYVRSLDLDNAVSSVSYTLDGADFTREYFVSNPDNVMVVRLTAQNGKIDRLVSVTSEQTKKTITVEGDTITMVGQPADHTAKGLHFAQQIKVIPTGGSMTATEMGLMVSGADEVLIFVSCGTNYVQCADDTYNYFSSEDPLVAVSARLDAAVKKGYDAVKRDHIKDYRSLYTRVQLDLGARSVPKKTTAKLLAGYKSNSNTTSENRYLEMLYYQFGRYLLISSSREGSLPANLQGIWAEGMSPPWSADYHTNINVQMNYWLAEQTNLTECHSPVIDYINAQIPRGIETAKLYHVKQDGSDVRGWTMYHENNIWGNTMPAVSDAFYFPAGGAWMCQDIWEYYAFTMDKDFLAKNFDTLLGAAIFWVDNLWTDSDGTLVSNPSYSPEHGPYSLGASCDQDIVWELFDEVLKAADILTLTDEQAAQVAEVKAAKEKLWMPKIGLSGIFMEWKDETKLDISGDNGHRHVNHLYALHPGTYVVAGRSEEDDKNVEAMKKVLNIRGDGGTGWSKAWKINFWARLRDGERAGKLVNGILKESTSENLFDICPPFQIDGNFGATAGITEMLLQSQGDSIDLLAALPSMWANGSVTGLKARGNYEVSMEWAKGKLQAAVITANVGGDCKLRGENLASMAFTDSKGNPVAVTKVDDNTVTFVAKAGESYVVTTSDADEPANKDELKTEVDAAVEDLTGYIEETVEAYQQKLAEANEVLADARASQEDVNTALAALKAAKDALTLWGDANSDRDVTTADVRLILQYAAELEPEDKVNMKAANVNGDQEVTTADARYILQYCAEILDKLPVENQ